MEQQKRALRRAIRVSGGGSVVAKSLGISPSAVSQWQRCPAERVLEVERLSQGRVSRYLLRPDVFGAPEITAA
ncbi:transcriptional regulator [Magnetococcus sp. PR-3]|uniref:transcriptional regulator n=1 Tax=Magnetococcus sp. PR-3 TaxID=3120355 RepID=UPI002FCE1A8A